MPRRDVQFSVGEYYHLYNRGSNRQRIFFERENYLFFLRRVRDGTLPSPEIVLSQFPNRSAYQAFVMSYTESDQDVIAHLMLD